MHIHNTHGCVCMLEDKCRFYSLGTMLPLLKADSLIDLELSKKASLTDLWILLSQLP